LGWAATLCALAALFACDLILGPRRSPASSFRAAVAWSVFYVAVALGFGLVLALASGWGLGAEYFSGYLVEKSLSVDNLFVFVVIIAAFSVPIAHQPRALTIGILVALAMRAVFIALGASLLGAFSFMFVIFGLVLLATAVQLLRHRHRTPSAQDNRIVAAARRVLPIGVDYDHGRFCSRRSGRLILTPMFLVLVAIASTDLLFALDSIPAVFGVTTNAYVVFCANAFALLGLRPLFFVVSGLLSRLVYLSVGLALILALIGVKLILHFAHLQSTSVPEISTGASLAAIVAVLAVTTAASLRKTRGRQARRALPRPDGPARPDAPAHGARANYARG
jgi:tellurite resistance protein TerC